MPEPRKQPLVQYPVREAWDTGEEDHLTDTVEEAAKLKAHIVSQIVRDTGLSEDQAAKFVTVYLLARIDL